MSARQPFPFKQRHSVAVSVDHIDMVVDYDYTAASPLTRFDPGSDAEFQVVCIEIGDVSLSADKLSEKFKRAIEAAVMREHE